MTNVVRAVCFPLDDDGFVVRVQQLVRLVDHVDRVAGTFQEAPAHGEPLQAAMEALLRETYPLAVVAPREARPASADGDRVWEVYRDGAFAPRPGDLS
jgi:hypothetical protein